MHSHVSEGYMITHELCHMAGQYQAPRPSSYSTR